MKTSNNAADTNKGKLVVSCPYLTFGETKVAKCHENGDYIAESWVLNKCSQDPSNCSLFVRNVKRDYNKGTRIKLLSMAGETQMWPGITGVVESVDDIGQVHVNWNNGSRLALNVYLDKFEIISE